MATVRIQLRRGEYQDWYDANPQLAAGELAIETDTNRIKIGDGSTNWRNLDYAIVNNDGTPLTTDDYGQPDGVPQLDGSGYIKSENLPPLAKITVHSVANQAARLALTVEPGDIAIQSDTGTSYVLQSSPASTNANWKELTATQAINDAVNAAVTAMLDGAPGALNTLNELAAAIGDDPTFFTTVATNLSNHENDATNVHGIADTSLLATMSYADQAEADAKAYTDTREGLITSAYQNYADQAEGDAKAYTDARESAITTAYQAYADQAEVDAKAYTDARESAITTAYQAHVSGRESAITNAYQTYADQAEVDAKAYADQKVSDLVDSSPAALNTLNELAAALGDDANFATTVTTSIGTKVAKAGDTMTGPLILSGSPAEALHATNKSYVDNLIQGYGATASANLDGHNSTTLNVHGIADTSLLATKAYADGVGTTAATELSNHSADTTSVHGISNTADLATKSYADNAATAAQSAAETAAGTSLTAHADDTTGIHGITNTANLVYTDDARLSDTRTPTDNTVSTAKIVDLAVTTGKINDLSITSDKLAADSVSTAKIANTSVTADKLSGDSVTTVKIADLNVTTAKINDGAVTSAKIANDTIATANIADDAVTSVKIANNTIITENIADDAVTSAKIANDTIATANIADGAVTSAKILNDTIVNADINSAAAIDQSKIANLTTDLDLKAPLNSPTFTGTVTLPGTTAIGDVSATEIGYVNGVTSAIQTQIDSKSSTVSPTFTGTVTLPSTTSVGDVSSSEIAYLNGVTSGIQSQIDTKLASATAASTYAPIASPTFTGTVVLPSTTSVGDVSSTELGYLNGVTSAVQTQINAKADSSTVTSHTSATTSVHGISDTSQLAYKNAANQTFTGNLEVDGNMTVDGNLTVNGTTFNASATSITIEDNMVQLAHQNATNTVDLGLVVAYTDGTAKHAGIVRDVSDSKWKIFKDVTDEPATTVNFGQGSLDNLAVNNVEVSGVVFADGTQTKEGVPSRTTVDSKTADYTLVLTDRDKMIEINSSSSLTISIPTDASVNFPVGTSVDLLRVGSGAVTIAAVTPATTTLNYTPGNKLRAQWSSATLFKRAANTWVLMGDLTA